MRIDQLGMCRLTRADNSSVFKEDVNAIAEAGITRGCNPPDNDRYCPDDLLTRGQAAAFMRRALLR